MPSDPDNSELPHSPRISVDSPFTTGLLPNSLQPLGDGTDAIEIGDGRIRVCHRWEDLFSQGRLTVTVFIAFEGTTESCDNYRRIAAEVDYAKAYFAGSACPISMQLGKPQILAKRIKAIR